MTREMMLGSAALAVCLSACAGGGGSGGGTSVAAQPTTTLPAATTPPPVSSADSFRTVEYNRMGALDAVHAADAYAVGYTGAGVTIGIVDFNFELGSAEVAFDPASRDSTASAMALY